MNPPREEEKYWKTLKSKKKKRKTKWNFFIESNGKLNEKWCCNDGEQFIAYGIARCRMYVRCTCWRCSVSSISRWKNSPTNANPQLMAYKTRTKNLCACGQMQKFHRSESGENEFFELNVDIWYFAHRRRSPFVVVVFFFSRPSFLFFLSLYISNHFQQQQFVEWKSVFSCERKFFCRSVDKNTRRNRIDAQHRINRRNKKLSCDFNRRRFAACSKKLNEICMYSDCLASPRIDFTRKFSFCSTIQSIQSIFYHMKSAYKKIKTNAKSSKSRHRCRSEKCDFCFFDVHIYSEPSERSE